MIDLKRLRAEHPECFASSERLRAYLLINYPEESKGVINILVTAWAEGVLAYASGVKKLAREPFCKQLCDDYGFDKSLVKECYAVISALFEEPPFVQQPAPELPQTASLTIDKSGGSGSPVIEKSENILYDYPTLEIYDESEFVINGTKLYEYIGKSVDVKIPFGITEILEDAFRDNKKIVSVNIPNSVTVIGNNAFRGCSGLKSISIPNSVTIIGEAAFCSCGGLNSITIPNRVKSTGKSAFASCSGLKSIIIPDSVTSIDYCAFYNCSELESVTISDSVTSIGERAFQSCSKLENITIPVGVAKMSFSVFDGCRKLKKIFCEAKNKPSGWFDTWNSGCPAKVYWGA